VFWTLKKLGVTVSGDIGCYTLGVSAPLQAMDTCVCMGASIGVAHGLERAGVAPSKIVGVIGDSTFLHSGITGLLDMVYNDAHGTILILDNGTTAMTGRQEHAGTGTTLQGNPASQVDLEALVRALGVQDVAVVDPYDMAIFEQRLVRALDHAGPSVLIARRPCMLIPHEQRPKMEVDPGTCKLCGKCLKLGCPAISKVHIEVDGKARVRPVVDPQLCNGCSQCAQVCPFESIRPAVREASGIAG
jgi:indolepyruvate ferredoxin oxidoreductase alpha subunit